MKPNKTFSIEHDGLFLVYLLLNKNQSEYPQIMLISSFLPGVVCLSYNRYAFAYNMIDMYMLTI